MAIQNTITITDLRTRRTAGNGFQFEYTEKSKTEWRGCSRVTTPKTDPKYLEIARRMEQLIDRFYQFEIQLRLGGNTYKRFRYEAASLEGAIRSAGVKSEDLIKLLTELNAMLEGVNDRADCLLFQVAFELDLANPEGAKARLREEIDQAKYYLQPRVCEIANINPQYVPPIEEVENIRANNTSLDNWIRQRLNPAQERILMFGESHSSLATKITFRDKILPALAKKGVKYLVFEGIPIESKAEVQSFNKTGALSPKLKEHLEELAKQYGLPTDIYESVLLKAHSLGITIIPASPPLDKIKRGEQEYAIAKGREYMARTGSSPSATQVLKWMLDFQFLPETQERNATLQDRAMKEALGEVPKPEKVIVYGGALHNNRDFIQGLLSDGRLRIGKSDIMGIDILDANMLERVKFVLQTPLASRIRTNLLNYVQVMTAMHINDLPRGEYAIPRLDDELGDWAIILPPGSGR